MRMTARKKRIKMRNRRMIKEEREFKKMKREGKAGDVWLFHRKSSPLIILGLFLLHHLLLHLTLIHLCAAPGNLIITFLSIKSSQLRQSSLHSAMHTLQRVVTPVPSFARLMDEEDKRE